MIRWRHCHQYRCQPHIVSVNLLRLNSSIGHTCLLPHMTVLSLRFALICHRNNNSLTIPRISSSNCIGISITSYLQRYGTDDWWRILSVSDVKQCDWRVKSLMCRQSASRVAILVCIVNCSCPLSVTYATQLCSRQHIWDDVNTIYCLVYITGYDMHDSLRYSHIAYA